jgi:hypothetical protein
VIGTGAHIAVSTVERVNNELGVKPPAGYVAALAEADTLTKNLAAVSNRDAAADLIDAVFASVQAGGHPADDDNVRRLLAMTQLQNYELHRQADERTRAMRGDAVCRFADQFIELWAGAVADDGKTLWETAQSATFADVADLNDMHPSQLINAEHHQQWISASVAGRRLDSAATGFTSMLSATRLNFPTGYGTLILAPQLGIDGLTEVNRATEHGRRPTAWDLARHGHVPTLCASMSDFAAACGAVSAEQYARDEASRESTNLTRFS